MLSLHRMVPARRARRNTRRAILNRECLPDVLWILDVLADASRSLAKDIGYCPALDLAGARVVHHGHEMNARWRRAVLENGLRNRNLLTLSPWDVFPRGRPADFTYMNLFVFSMLLLVMGDNFLMMFVGWEGVGLCSYLLIGFWFEDNEKASAGKKAFIVNRIGDFGFLLGIFFTFYFFVIYILSKN